MPTNRKVIDFKIHNLTEEQFQELKEAGQIDPNAIYCTPDETVTNFEAVNARIDETNKKLNTFESGVNETVGVINTTIVNVDKKVDEAIQTEQQHNIEINARVDKTDDKLDKKVSVVQGEENAGKVLVVNEDGEVVPDKPKVGASLPILTHVFADHELNDMSWLNADTFSWQSGDVYKAVYEHLANEAIFESETKKYIYVSRKMASGELEPVDKKFYRTPEADYYGEYAYEGFILAWRSDDGFVVSTNTENPNVSDTVYNYGKQDKIPDDPPPSSGRVVEAGEVIVSGDMETEKIDGITIVFYRAEDGHKICPVNQEANVQALYEKTGVAWYYILDIKNKQFKLPRTKFGFTGLRDSVGGYVKAGVPNIYGYMNNILSDGYDNSSKTQALTAKTAGTNFYTPQSSGYGLRAESWTFDASHSNSIYGNSGTVQPPATQMYLYFYVGNFEQSAKEQTAGLNAELFNGKADIDDVANLAMPSSRYVDLTLGSSESSYTAPADGYVILGKRVNGNVMQFNCLKAQNSSGYISRIESANSVSGYWATVMMPVKKGRVFSVEYTTTGTVAVFRFVYANGAE